MNHGAHRVAFYRLFQYLERLPFITSFSSLLVPNVQPPQFQVYYGIFYYSKKFILCVRVCWLALCHRHTG